MKNAPEGWQWVRIQDRACPQCGQDPAARPPWELGEVAADSAAGWKEFLRAADDSHLRANPAADVWSPIQYGAHVRDMVRVFGDRILLALREDDPAVEWFDPGPEGWAWYNRMPVDELIADLDDQVRRFAAIVAERGAGDWDRTARRDGVDRFTVSGLACFAVHEAHHHLLDAQGRIRPAH